MEHEITLRTTEDLILPQVTPDIRRRQTDLQLHNIPCNLDLTKLSVDYALQILGGLDPHTTAFLVVADGSRDRGVEFAKEFRLALIVLPPEVMHNDWSWALVSAKGTVYSRPSGY